MESATQESPAQTTASTPPSAERVPACAVIPLLGRRWMPGWLSRWPIEQRVLAGFGLVFASVLVISVVSYRNTAVMVQNSRLDTRTYELIQLLRSIEEALVAAESGHRRYLVTGDESYLRAHQAIVEQMPDYTRYFHALVANDSEQRDSITQLEQLIKQQLDIEAQAIKQRAEQGADAVRHLALPGVA